MWWECSEAAAIRKCVCFDTSGVWFIGVPFAFLGALVWHLPIYGVYAPLCCQEEIYKMILATYVTARRNGLKIWHFRFDLVVFLLAR